MIDYVESAIQRRLPHRAELQVALNLIPAYAWYAAPSGALTFVNERGSDYLGLPKDHPLRLGIDTGAEWYSHIPFLHPDDHEKTRRVWSACLRTGCAGQVSFRVRNAEGGYRWFLSCAEPVRASDGTLLYWIGVNLDIEERKQAEFYLAEGQRLAQMGSWAFNAAGFDHWSPELFRIHGLDPSGKAPTVEQYLALVHPEDREFVAQAIQKMLADNRGFDFTKRIVRPDGEIRQVRCVGIAATPGGTFQGFVGTGMDVTEQEQLTRELRRREAYLAEAQRLSHTGSFGWNVSTDDHFWSDETFRIFEFAPSSKVSLQMILDCVHPQDMPSLNMAIAAANKAEGIDLEFRLLMPDGRVKYLHVVGKAERGEAGVEVIGAVMDVTARKLTEVELRRSKAHLADAQRLSRTGCVGMERSTKRIFWSEEAARIYGYPPGTEPTPDLILRRSHPDDVGLVKDALQRAAQGGNDFDYEHRLLMPDGSIKYLHDLAHCFRDEAGDDEVVGAIMDITERKVAEEAILRSEAYLAEAQRLSHTGSFGWKPDTGEIVWSDETYRIFEYDRSLRPTIDSVAQRVHPQDRADFQKVIDGATRGVTDFEHAYRLLLPDGRVKHVLAIAHDLQDASGNREFVGAVTDITKQRQAEAVIREQEAELREVVDTIPAIVWSAIPDGSNSYVNSRYVEYCGMSPEQIAGSGWQAVAHPDDLERHKAKWLACVAGGEPCEDEVRFRRADGQYRWHLQRGVPLRDETGDIVKWYGVLTDIEDLKRAEDKIREQETELRQMLDFAPQLIAVYGPNRERLYANRVALDYAGLNINEWRQTEALGAFIHPDDRERELAYFARARSDGSAGQLELRLRGGDGGYRWFLARYNSVRDNNGQILRWYVSCTDIEDRKRAEERLQQENVALREEIDETSMFEEIVGTSPALQSVLSRISKVAPSDSTVLITGETGTGKELVARAIHRRSRRASRAFVSVNCAAIPRELIASELFGHEKGAFTGATQRRLGRFELADGGTIFLDEVGELSPDIQVALLRALQEREFERVGGSQPIHVDVRVIAATNRDLKAAVANGTFRQDLFYRLNVFPILAPPLRERKDDILTLAEYFIQRYASRAGKNIRSIDKKALDLLRSYDWPGNVRELQNIIERSVILSSGDVFSVDESWLSIETLPHASRVEASERLNGKAEPRTEREIIEAALAETRGRVSGPSGAAARLGISPSTLDNRIKALKINKRQFKYR